MLEDPDDWSALSAYLNCLLPASCPPQHRKQRKGIVAGIEPLCAQLNDSQYQNGAAGSAQASRASSLHLCCCRHHRGLSLPYTGGAVPQGGEQEGISRAEQTTAALMQQVRPGGRRAEAAQAGAMRGPFLAPAELELRRLRLSPTEAASRDTRPLAEAVLQAYKHLGSAVSCASDLRSYSAVVQGPDRQWLMEQIQRECEQREGKTDTTDRKSAMLQLRRRVGAYQVLRRPAQCWSTTGNMLYA